MNRLINADTHLNYINDTIRFALGDSSDDEHFVYDEECPCCGGKAESYSTEELFGGVINSVSVINCTVCHFHKCDREYCSTCEAEAERRNKEAQDEFNRTANIAFEMDRLLKLMIEQLKSTGSINPKVMTTFKTLVISNEDCIGEFDLFCNDSRIKLRSINDMLKFAKSSILDARFECFLDKLVKEAKQDLDI